MNPHQITMVVKNGQADFLDIPENVNIYVKNYDVDPPKTDYISERDMESENLYKDEDGWFSPHVFSPTVSVEDLDESQLPLPAMSL